MSSIGRSAHARRETYRALFDAAADERAVDHIRQATNFVLDSARLAQENARALGRRVERGKPGRPPRKNTDGTA
jgi:putative transposase